jgi:hypothetical protein
MAKLPEMAQFRRRAVVRIQDKETLVDSDSAIPSGSVAKPVLHISGST